MNETLLFITLINSVWFFFLGAEELQYYEIYISQTGPHTNTNRGLYCRVYEPKEAGIKAQTLP